MNYDKHYTNDGIIFAEDYRPSDNELAFDHGATARAKQDHWYYNTECGTKIDTSYSDED